MKNPFKRQEINPYSISDRVRFRNLDKTLDLNVRAAASTLVVGIRAANEKMVALRDDSPEKEKAEAAMEMAGNIFGKEQASMLMEFYNGDSLAVVNACYLYFSTRLAKLITKAQKK